LNEVYDDAMRQKVREIYRKDFEYFYPAENRQEKTFDSKERN